MSTIHFILWSCFLQFRVRNTKWRKFLIYLHGDGSRTAVVRHVGVEAPHGRLRVQRHFEMKELAVSVRVELEDSPRLDNLGLGRWSQRRTLSCKTEREKLFWHGSFYLFGGKVGKGIITKKGKEKWKTFLSFFGQTFVVVGRVEKRKLSASVAKKKMGQA